MAVKSYEEATTLITAINQVLALRNFVDPRRNKWKFVCSLIYNILVIVALSSITIFNQIKIFKRLSFTIEILLYILLFIIVISGYITIGIIGLCSSKQALALIKQINTVDEKLMKLGAKIEYRGLFQYVIINGLFWTLSWIIILFLMVLLMNKMDKSSLISSICYISILNITSITLYDLNTVVHWLGERFKQTNELLAACLLENHQTKAETECSFERSIGTIDVQSSEEESQSAAKIYLIHEIRLVHLQLCCTSKMLNRLFEAQILAHVFTTLIYTTITFYYTYMELVRKPEMIWELYTIGCYILDAIIHSVKLIIVSYNCEYTTSQMNKVIKIMHASTLYENNNDIKDEIVQFCVQISCMRVGKSQYPSLWLNYGFICQSVATVLTNVIVMIQWSDDVIMKEKRMVTNETNRV